MLIFTIMLFSLSFLVLTSVPLYYCLVLLAFVLVFAYLTVYLGLFSSLFVIMVLVVYVGAIMILIGYISAVTPNSLLTASSFLSLVLLIICFILILIYALSVFGYFTEVWYTSSNLDSFFSFFFGVEGFSLFFLLVFSMLFLMLFSSQSVPQSSPIRNVDF